MQGEKELEPKDETNIDNNEFIKACSTFERISFFVTLYINSLCAFPMFLSVWVTEYDIDYFVANIYINA